MPFFSCPWGARSMYEACLSILRPCSIDLSEKVDTSHRWQFCPDLFDVEAKSITPPALFIGSKVLFWIAIAYPYAWIRNTGENAKTGRIDTILPVETSDDAI